MKYWHMYSINGKSIVALKEGVNWFAFCFGGLWAFVNRLYIQGIVGVLLGFAFNAISVMQPVLSFFLLLGLGLVYGFYGNIWRGKKLIKSGFAHDKTIRAKSVNEAIVEYKRIVNGLSA